MPLTCFRFIILLKDTLSSGCRGSEQLPKEHPLREVSSEVESQGPSGSLPVHGRGSWVLELCCHHVRTGSPLTPGPVSSCFVKAPRRP